MKRGKRMKRVKKLWGMGFALGLSFALMGCTANEQAGKESGHDKAKTSGISSPAFA